MATQRKKKEITDEQLVNWYTDYCLSHGKRPKSIYEFAKLNAFEEVHFYKYFASFDALEMDFFSKIFYHTLQLLQENSNYASYDSAQKLTSFYFTFFEMMTANRSFVKLILEEGKLPMQNVKKLKILRSDFLMYAESILEAPYAIPNEKITKVQHKIVHEGAWLQFLAMIRFWMEDTSASFEKTDIYIEKSVKASFDMVYNTPVESIVDFAKFLWKEKMGTGFTYTK